MVCHCGVSSPRHLRMKEGSLTIELGIGGSKAGQKYGLRVSHHQFEFLETALRQAATDYYSSEKLTREPQSPLVR
jgi:hypothetical protein